MKQPLPSNTYLSGKGDLSAVDQAMIERRVGLLGPAYKLHYEQPLHVVRGEGVWLYDAQDNAYLDAYNNVPSVGHCHPRVHAALSGQAGLLNTHTRYLHPGILDYAEHLLSTFPDPFDKLMLTCSGSEANDLAYRIAQLNTGGTGFIVTELAYHGVTKVIAELSPALGEHANLGEHVRTVPAPDAYRNDGSDGEVGKRFARAVQAAIDDMSRHGIKPAAMMVDTIFASDGVLADPPGFLQQALKVVQNAGALFIADEVQAGFGRTGDHWWGFQRHAIEPDIVTMGKGMGGGHPIAGVALPGAQLEALAKSRYFNTTGGNPVSCAVGKAILEVIEEEDLMENARSTGAYLRSGLAKLADQHDIIGQVRGAGLFIGLELVRDRASKEPAAEETLWLVNRCRQDRVLISSTGTHGNVLKIRPPLPFSPDNADVLLRVLDRALADCPELSARLA